MTKTTVMIHVDALRHDYVTPEDMPFLYSLAQQGMSGSIIPPFGFEPDGAYFTGRTPEEYEGGVHFVYSPETSPYRFARFLPGWFDRMGPYVSYGFRRQVAERLVRRLAPNDRVRVQSYIGRIPYKLLPFFDLGDKEYAYEPGAFNRYPTLFDLVRESGMKCFYHGAPQWPVQADSVTQRVLRDYNGEEPFLFLFIGDLDVVGHKAGPETSERRTVCRKVDDNLGKISKHLESFGKPVKWLLFGDHGMVSVEQGIDVEAALKPLPVKRGRDYACFLDSTFARFWFFNDRAREVIEPVIRALPRGTVISEGDQAEYQICYKTRKFGDLIFWADGGVVIHPDYWHFRGMKKGMHGYRKEVRDNHAAFVCSCSSAAGHGTASALAAMQDVFATAVAMLGLEKPQGAGGKPVWER
jgi:hypothetical protein